MKKVLLLSVGLLLISSVCRASISCEAPFDFTGFEPMSELPESVVKSGDTITFTESFSDAALYFFNDQYAVDPQAGILSFEYRFLFGESDFDDTLQFDIGGEPKMIVSTNGVGYFEFDLSPYQGQTISMDWGLIWNGDGSAGTTASISNVCLVPAAPVPVPAALYLLGSGLLCVVLRKR
jgi:hypothetical protein